MPSRPWLRPALRQGLRRIIDPPVTPEAPPAPCRECGLQYYRPFTSPPRRAASANQAKGTSGAPARLEPESGSGRSHLSSDPRVRTARGSSNATVLPRPWRSCGLWFPLTILTRRTCGFSWAWPPAGGPRSRAGGRKTSGATGRGHRGLPVHPDPPAGTGARAPGTGPGLLSEGGGPVGP